MRGHRAMADWQCDALADEPTLSELDGVRYLHFNSEWVQGAMRLARPSELVLGYTQQMMAWLLFEHPGVRDRVGILGLGAGSLLRFVLRHTRARVDVVERNQQVVAMCRAYFRLSTSARLELTLNDARSWVADLQRAGRYCALMVDLYDAKAQGPVCDGLDFYRQCWQLLDDPGVMTVNLFGHHASFDRNLQNIRAAFGGRVLCLPEVDEGNTVVLAFKGNGQYGSPEQLLDRAQVLQARMGLTVRPWIHGLLAHGDEPPWGPAGAV